MYKTTIIKHLLFNSILKNMKLFSISIFISIPLPIRYSRARAETVGVEVDIKQN